MSFNVEVAGGTSVRLPTAGKYCARDIVVTATGDGSAQDNAQYASALHFEKAVFPEGYEMHIHLNNTTTLPRFRNATGIRKITFDVPIDKSYDATYLVYPNTSVEEIVFPDGIKINTPNMMATNCTSLVSVFGRMDFTGAATPDVFNGCANLVDVSFMPLSITHSKSFKHSGKLSVESRQSIAYGLADLTGQTAQTLTVHPSTYAKMVEEGLDVIITAKNWIIAS